MPVAATSSQQRVGVRCPEDEGRELGVDVVEKRTEDCEGASRILLNGDCDYDGLVVDGLEVLGAELLGHAAFGTPGGESDQVVLILRPFIRDLRFERSLEVVSRVCTTIL